MISPEAEPASRWPRLALVGLVALLGAALVISLAPRIGSPDRDAVGTNDFVAYWSAHHVAAAGGNPYDTAAIGRVQAEIGMTQTHGVMPYRNPPWLLLVLDPILRFGFRTSAVLFFVANLAMTAVAEALAWSMFGRTKLRLLSIVPIGVLFVPALDNILIGQVSLFVAVVFFCGLKALHLRRDVLAGLAFALCSVKP